MKYLALFLFLLPGAASANLNLEQFQERMKKHVASLTNKTTVSVQIEVLGKNTELFSHNSRSQLIPASNAKLITALAALDKMGAGYSFETKVLRNGDDLVLMGNGDPYFVSERLYLLARDVARSGIKKVNAIHVNNSAFEENYRGLIDWDKSGEPFTAMVSPTSLNFNSIEIHVIPTATGKNPRIELGPLPHGYATIRNEVTQVAGNRKSLGVRPIKTEDNKEIFAITGTIGRNATPGIVYASVRLPESYLAHTFAALLRQEGITVGKDFGGVSFLPPGNFPLVAKQDGPPLLDLVRLFNTFSNNFMTEQVFQAFGAVASGGAASIGKSQQAVTEFLKKRESCKDAILDNGSGLSWNSRVSAKCFTDTLQWSYRDFRVFADLLGSLPVGGQTGTLKTRFRRAGSNFDPLKVRAKTGTLWSRQVVTSLVGFTQTASGEPVVFALLENDERSGPDQLNALKDWEDRSVELIQQLQL